MSSADDQIAATVEELSLTMRAVVYTGNSWSTVAKSGLKCSLSPLNVGISAVQTGQDRTELAARGLFEWERGYTMPAGVRIAVDAYGSQRWNVMAGTIWPEFGPDGGLIFWHGDVTKVS